VEDWRNLLENFPLKISQCLILNFKEFEFQNYLEVPEIFIFLKNLFEFYFLNKKD